MLKKAIGKEYSVNNTFSNSIRDIIITLQPTSPSRLE